MAVLLAAVLELNTLAAVIPLIGSLIDAQSVGSSFIVNSARLPEFMTQWPNPHDLVLGTVLVYGSQEA